MALLFALSFARAQTVSPSQGELTVRLTQGLDSMTQRAGQTSAGIVIKSNATAAPRGTPAVVQLINDNGTFSVRLVSLTLIGQSLPAASSAAALTGVSRVLGLARQAGAPQNSVSGNRVFLPESTEVRFTLTAPPAVAAAPAPAVRTAAQPPVSVVQSWRLVPDPHSEARTETVQAVLPGTARGNGVRGPALLRLGCHVNHFDPPNGTTAHVDASVEVRGGLIGFTVGDYDCEGDMDGSYNAVYTRIGAQPEINAGLCATMEDPNNRNSKGTLTVGYSEPHFEELMDGTGQPLTIQIRDLKSHQSVLEAQFQLPPDSTAVQRAMSSCLENVKAHDQKEKNAIVAACPEVMGQTLQKVEVFTGAAQRPAVADSDNDIGTAWTFPKPVKVRPKLTLACSYGKDADVAPGEKLQRRTFPVPATASFCVARHDGEDNHLFGRCETKDGTGY